MSDRVNTALLKPERYVFSVKDVIYLLLYLCFMGLCLLNIPKSVALYQNQRTACLSVGLIGLWRYAWWSVHVVRSIIYAKWVFPKRRLLANRLWDSGWRPQKIFIMMTTYNEIIKTTEKVLQSLLDECLEIGVPVKLFIGTGSEFDENVIETFFHKKKVPTPFEVIIVRQIHSGKRHAIGETLRVIQKNGLGIDDPVIFMDGDTWFIPGCLQKCLPFFHLYPNLQALTTHEQALLRNGPSWMKKWLDMRFAQRDFTMQSYALSDRILTLTGRMSIFRGKHLLNPEFVKVIENDYLSHWLWGNYRFLSGDDKSTWFFLLKEGSDMMYVPDAITVTIENIIGNPFDRMIENLRRWCGNTLRNGARAIHLGPYKTGFFVWWCLIDQRISIWTMLAGHMAILALCFTKTPGFLLAALLWIAFSRFCTSLVLYYHAKKLDITFPFLLYFNQLLSALIKVYIVFRLPKQKWKNRGDQQQGFDAPGTLNLKNWIANYLMVFYCMGLFWLVLLYLGLISTPTLSDIKMPDI